MCGSTNLCIDFVGFGVCPPFFLNPLLGKPDHGICQVSISDLKRVLRPVLKDLL